MGTKIFKVLFVLVLTVSAFFGVVGSKAEAASSNGGYIKVNGGKCTVKLYTDYYTYSKTASTVDAWATASGTCKNMKYKIDVRYGDSGHVAIKDEYIQSGSFSFRTPDKKFAIKNIGKKEPSTTYRVFLTLYADGGSKGTDTKVIIKR